MEQTVPFENLDKGNVIPMCQKCFDAIATEVCKCGCPLCFSCSKKHACNRTKKGHFTN